MALQLISAYGKGNLITTIWHPQMVTNNLPDPSVFAFNYGSLGITSYEATANNKLIFTLDRELTYNEGITFSYTPPGDATDLTQPYPVGSSAAVIESAKALAIANFNVDNLQGPDAEVEDKTNYNLGVNYPKVSNGTPSSPVVDDFIATYGWPEALQLSNIHDASATTINETRIERAIEDANALVEAYIEQAPKAGKLLVSSSRRRTSMIIARYYLDSVRRRQDVVDDYERAIKELDLLTSPARDNVNPDNPDLAVNGKGLVRVFRVPQRYNSVSGKGFSNYPADFAYDHQPDRRTGSMGQDNNIRNNKGDGLAYAGSTERYTDGGTVETETE